MTAGAFLRGDDVALCPVTEDEYAFVRTHWNDPSLRRWFAISEPLREVDVAAMLDADDETHFVVRQIADGNDRTDGGPVGFLWLFDVDDVTGRGELGYWIAPDHQGKGYGTAAAALGLRYAFDEQGFHKVVARVLEGNEASKHVLETLGFEAEGLLREHYYVDGEYLDATLFGRLAETW